MIEDLNSTNGIFVQGKRVRRHNLNDGDIVVIGKHEILYVDERRARARMNSAQIAPNVPTLDKPVPDHGRTESNVEPVNDAADQDADEAPPGGRAANRSQ